MIPLSETRTVLPAPAALATPEFLIEEIVKALPFCLLRRPVKSLALLLSVTLPAPATYIFPAPVIFALTVTEPEELIVWFVPVLPILQAPVPAESEMVVVVLVEMVIAPVTFGVVRVLPARSSV